MPPAEENGDDDQAMPCKIGVASRPSMVSTPARESFILFLRVGAGSPRPATRGAVTAPLRLHHPRNPPHCRDVPVERLRRAGGDVPSGRLYSPGRAAASALALNGPSRVLSRSSL